MLGFSDLLLARCPTMLETAGKAVNLLLVNIICINQNHAIILTFPLLKLHFTFYQLKYLLTLDVFKLWLFGYSGDYSFCDSIVRNKVTCIYLFCILICIYLYIYSFFIRDAVFCITTCVYNFYLGNIEFWNGISFYLFFSDMHNIPFHFSVTVLF